MLANTAARARLLGRAGLVRAAAPKSFSTKVTDSMGSYDDNFAASVPAPGEDKKEFTYLLLGGEWRRIRARRPVRWG